MKGFVTESKQLRIALRLIQRNQPLAK